MSVDPRHPVDRALGAGTRVFAGVLGLVLGVVTGLVTVLLTELVTNNAAAILVFPIGMSVAHSMGAEPEPFAIAIAMAASASFLTPIGYQTNLLVYGPGGYRFSDYLKLGMPLNLIVIVCSAVLIPLVWPF